MARPERHVRTPFSLRCAARRRLSYDPHDRGSDQAGKSTDRSDIVRGRFVDLEPDTRVVEEVRFEDAGPEFEGTMTIETLLKPVTDGTKVTVVATSVPSGISADDHRKGMESSLKSLAMLLE